MSPAGADSDPELITTGGRAVTTSLENLQAWFAPP
jgi:hypothetical protein